MTDQSQATVSDLRSMKIGRAHKPKSVEAGSPAILNWVDIADLRIDATFQRDVTKAGKIRIKTIAENFKWANFSTVFISPIEGGLYAVVDGQHRSIAAMLCGFEKVPAQIVLMSAQEQAASFVSVNHTQGRVSVWAVFKAALAAGEKWATEADRVCAEGNCTLMRQAPRQSKTFKGRKIGEIFSIGLIRKYLKNGGYNAVRYTLRNLRQTEFGQEVAAYSYTYLKVILEVIMRRPWLWQGDMNLVDALNEIDVWNQVESATEEISKRRRQGVLTGSVNEFATRAVGKALDEAMPKPAELLVG